MARELYMPKNGMDMEEGTIVKWLKNVGDKIEKDEPFMEIEIDKITMETESPAAGVLLAKLYEDGAVVPVLTAVGYIGEPGEKIPRVSVMECGNAGNSLDIKNYTGKKEIESIRKLTDIMDKQFKGELTERDREELKKHSLEWNEDIRKLTNILNQLS